jgi:uncharacterized FAD-dependent dehydrogenase
MKKEIVVGAFVASVISACTFTFNSIIFTSAFSVNRNLIVCCKGINSIRLHLLDTNSDEPSISTHTAGRSQKDPHVKKGSAKSEPLQRWRIFDVNVHPNDLAQSVSRNSNHKGSTEVKEKLHSHYPPQSPYLTSAVTAALLNRLKIKKSLPKPQQKNSEIASKDDEKSNVSIFKNIKVVRRSLDARKTTARKSSDGAPQYNYVIEFDLKGSMAKHLGLKHQPGRMEHLVSVRGSTTNSSTISNFTAHFDQLVSPKHEANLEGIHLSTSPRRKKKVVIVGAGPAGLFCAIELAKSQLVTPIVLERGQPVESRGKDIGSLIHRRSLNTESNFAFGEGGAGTWSDGKLTTRIGRNSLEVRKVLQTFVQFGAPESILVEGSPHLGTDNLVRLIKKMRLELRSLGGEIRFGARVTKINHFGGAVTGVDVAYGDAMERSGKDLTGFHSPRSGLTETIEADAIVLATGHSARDIYRELASKGIKLETKGFAVGFRVEHPQSLINKIQYGDKWGPSVVTGKAATDRANRKNILTSETPLITKEPQVQTINPGQLPVASYRLATNEAFDGTRNRGAYSFCMCPGGQIVPASTNPEECCVNGMSFSRRDSLWANSALVVTIDPNDSLLTEYISSHGILAGIAFQQDMERRAAKMGGGNLVVPVQRVTDFIQETSSISAPPSSYRLGVKPSPVHEIYCKPIINALKHALVNHFDRQMPGFVCEEALLHAVETRTSSPLRISRDPESMQAVGMHRLFPSGEGAGFAGGIVSAAVDGMLVAEAVIDDLFIGVGSGRSRSLRQRAIDFDY